MKNGTKKTDWMEIEPQTRINERKPKPHLNHDTRVAHTTQGGKGRVARLMGRQGMNGAR
jgi:hypothetical protein